MIPLGVAQQQQRGESGPETDFLFTVSMQNAGALLYEIPCQNVGVFNATVNWGDGSPLSTITAYNDLDLKHTYATTGIYQIRVSGTFPNIFFANDHNTVEIISVENLGVMGWLTLDRAFWGCSNMTSFVVGNTDVSAVTSLNNTFLDCTALTTTPDVSNWDTSSVQYLSGTFRNCPLLATDVAISGWNIGNVISASNFLNGTNGALSTAEYDATLINWEAQPHNSNVAAHFGDAQYTSGGAGWDARSSLFTNSGWTITDGGGI